MSKKVKPVRYRYKHYFLQNWKIVKTFNSDWELYNLEEDRTETYNLASKEYCRVKQMSNEWEKWAEKSNVKNYESKCYII